jgi:GAF domain-containing protein
VRATGLLDTPPEDAFDDLAAAAAELLGAPFGFITLVDGERSFWKAVVGTDDGVRQNTLGESFCQYVIEAGDDVLIDDASVSDRVRDNPSVESMGVRAYAGSPLRSAGGEILGTLCVIDTRPRRWSSHERAVLQVLAAAASAELRLRSALESADAERRALRELLMEAPAVIWRLRGPEHRVELVNRAALPTVGFREIELGRPMREAVPEVVDQGYIRMLDQVYATGRMATASEAPVELAVRPGGPVERRFYNYAMTPTRGGHGEVDGVLLVAVDVTEQVRSRESEAGLRSRAEAARERAERLGEMAASLSRAASEAEILRSIEGLARTTTGAVRAWLGLVDEARRNVVVAATAGGVTSEVIQEFALIPLDAALPVTDVIRHGAPLWSSSQAELAARYPSMPGAVERSRFEALALLPLVASGTCVGALAFTFEEAREFDPDERRFLTTVATLCAQALERARLYDRQRAIALALQRQLLPRALPAVAGMELASRYLPAVRGAATGGDWYDAVRLPDGRLALTVGDVVGHGIEAAATMGQIRSAWRALVAELDEPATLIEHLSRFARDVPGAGVTTALSCILAPGGRLSYARAGHPPPLVVSPRVAPRFLWGGAGVPLHSGVERQAQDTATIEDGDVLVLFTDGVFERRGESIDHGLDELARFAGEAGTSEPQALLDLVVHRFCVDAGDDCALLAVRVGGVGPSDP